MSDVIVEDDSLESADSDTHKRRHDVAGPERKKRGAPGAAQRFDSDPANAAPLDGFGDPFAVQMADGWTHLWVSERDANKYQWRRWEMGTWGDPRILRYGAVLAKDKGVPIKSPQGSMQLYIMRAEDFAVMHAQDANRQIHTQRLGHVRYQEHVAETRGPEIRVGS